MKSKVVHYIERPDGTSERVGKIHNKKYPIGDTRVNRKRGTGSNTKSMTAIEKKLESRRAKKASNA